MKKLIFILIIGSVVSMSCFVWVGCKPQVIIGNDSIIGKWQCIGIGYNDDIKYHDFTGVITDEFTSDGRWFHYFSPNSYIEYKYRIDGKNIYAESVANKPVEPKHWEYEYKFYDDKVRLKIVKGLISDTNTRIYQKVE